MDSLLLIYPPHAKNCEPPAGIARLAGFLRNNGVACTTLDANRLGFDYLLGLECTKSDRWSKRARKNLKANLTGLTQPHCYANFDRYKRVVADVNRVLAGVGEERGVELSLVNYQDQSSPVQSDDLLKAAAAFADNIFQPFYAEVISPIIAEQDPEYVGISLTYLSQAVPAFVLIGFLRNRFPQLKIILGGGLVTSWMRSARWSNPFAGLVDACIAGQGEQPLLDMLRKTTDRGVVAAPEYDCTDYLSPGFILPYGASSGCYWNKCLFCPETAEDNPYLPLAPERVMAELQPLVARYKPVLVHFLDNAVSPGLMQALVNQPPGVDWYGFARACPQLADETFCRKLRRSGCVMLKLGLESGDQHVLDSMHKGIQLDLVARVLRSLKSAGIMTYVYLLFGTPSEDEASARRTMEFTIRHQAEIGFLNLAIFNLPLAGPEAATLALNEFYGGDLSLYTDFEHPKGWSRRKIRSFLNKEFKRDPAIVPIIQRDPPFFTSNHAPLFHPLLKGSDGLPLSLVK
jgi:hypothetical protein